MKSKLALNKELAIIINNTCNLTCNNCGTGNCYNFKGTYRWSEEGHLYEKWAEVADFPEIDILGGEPYLNPELLDWAVNIRKLWPNANMTVTTNGTLLYLEKNIEVTRKFIEAGVRLVVSTHVMSDFEKFNNDIWKILEPWKDEIVITDGDIPGSKVWNHGDKIVAFNHPVVDMLPNYIKEVKNGIMYLDDGDVQASHDNCFWATNCYTLQRGLFYKCPLVTNYAEAKNQVRYEERAYPLLEKFKPCSPYDDIEDIKKFFEDLPKPIPACSLCAFEKKNNSPQPVTFDKSWKKAFKGN